MLCSTTPSVPQADANIPSYAHIVLHFLRALSPSAASGIPRGLLSPRHSRTGWMFGFRATGFPFMSSDVILIVDDSKFMAQAFSRVLLGLSYRARDGKTGLFAAESCNPTLILLDMLLPDMDGVDVLASALFLAVVAICRSIRCVLSIGRRPELFKPTPCNKISVASLQFFRNFPCTCFGVPLCGQESCRLS